MLPEVGRSVYIQSFKHDGSLHRTWSVGYVVEANDKQIVVITNKTWVIEADGRKWFTREPAVCFFYPDAWYNVISMIRKSGVYYYCNVASPSLFDGEAIKNIDYDLDVKLYPNGEYELLDEDEYEDHAMRMGYSNEIKDIIEDQLKKLVDRIDNCADPFNEDTIHAYYKTYQKMRANQNG